MTRTVRYLKDISPNSVLGESNSQWEMSTHHHIEAYCILEQDRSPEATPTLTVLKYGIRIPISIRDLLRVKGDSYSMLQYGSGKMRGPAAQPSG